jgi:peptidoglycan/xylan/chitin deacetylase (PgdA/CDA1 family)
MGHHESIQQNPLKLLKLEPFTKHANSSFREENHTRDHGRILRQYPVKLLRKSFSAIEKKVTGVVTHVTTSEAVAALTFDDGPNPQCTPVLLDILEKYQVHATFFMLGETAQKHLELVSKVAQAGHAIGNHSWNHPQFPSISSRERRWQIRACERAIAPYGQRLFRPPFGYHNDVSRFDAWWLGYRIINWDLDSRDWIDDDANSIADRLVNQIHSGSIILLHDGLFHPAEERYANRQAMLEAVAMVLQQLDGHFRFVTIPSLVKIGLNVRR